MTAFFAVLIGSMIGGTLISALFMWLARKLGSTTLASQSWAGFLGGCAIYVWGWWGDGVSVASLIPSFLGVGFGVIVNRELIRRRDKHQDDVETFY